MKAVVTTALQLVRREYEARAMPLLLTLDLVFTPVILSAAIFFVFLVFVSFQLCAPEQAPIVFGRVDESEEKKEGEEAAASAELDGGSGSCSGSPVAKQSVEEADVGADTQRQPWYILMAMVSFSFYTGFHMSTWAPFLLIREGQALDPGNAPVVFSCLKLIYALSVVVNPVWGKVSDIVSSKTTSGRSSFILAGLGMEVTAIFGARLARDEGNLALYYVATGLWLFGENVAAVAIEAIPVQLLHPSQYEVCSSLRSLVSFVGCLFGLLPFTYYACAVEVNYTWLYSCYIHVLMLCGIPPLLLSLQVLELTEAPPVSFGAILAPYIEPLRNSCFSYLCLAVFFSSAATGPMYQMLLFIQDIVGYDDPCVQTTEFSRASIAFLTSATISSIVCAVTAGDIDLVRAARILVPSSVAYGAVCLSMSVTFLPDTPLQRFYVLVGFSVAAGGAFGLMFSSIRTFVYSLVPSNCIANTMALTQVVQGAGIGAGNIAGVMIVYRFPIAGRLDHYQTKGYLMVLCFSCAMAWLGAVCVLALMHARPSVERRPSIQRRPSIET